MSEAKPVLGHLCDGLRAFQEIGRGCKPRIKSNGIVTGCDDENDVALTHCPFCGVWFGDAPREKSCGWSHCSCTAESHQDGDD